MTMVAAGIADVLDSGSLRVVGYLAVGTVAMIRFGLEQRVAKPRPPASWPFYWLLSALLLFFLGLSRATSLGGLIADLGRDQARSEGWYDARRTVQAFTVIAVIAVWFIGVVVAVWRVPPRRRRYLPSVVSISTLVAFAAVRMVSLHHIDTLLYRRGVGHVRFVAVIELMLLAATFAMIVLVPRLDNNGPQTVASSTIKTPRSN